MRPEGDTWGAYLDWVAWLGYGAAVFAPLLGLVVAIPIVIRGDWRNFAGVLTAVVASFLIHLALIGGSYGVH